MSGVNLPYIHSHTLHDVDTVAEGEYNTFLSGTKQVAAVMQVEVDTLNRTSGFLILQHTFSSVTKRKDADAGSTDRCLSGNLVHFCIAEVGSQCAFHPRIEDTRTVDAEQYAQTGL